MAGDGGDETSRAVIIPSVRVTSIAVATVAALATLAWHLAAGDPTSGWRSHLGSFGHVGIWGSLTAVAIGAAAIIRARERWPVPLAAVLVGVLTLAYWIRAVLSILETT